MPTTAQTRITGGQWRGRLLSTPREQLLRPTRSVVREALFNRLGDAVVGARFIDIYAGAGTVGLEALSRGASHAVFVDRDDRALVHVRVSAGRLGCTESIRTDREDALEWVRSHPTDLRAADIVFLDAPYRDDGVAAVLRALAVSPPPLLVCEHHRARVLPDRVGDLEVVRHGRYGITDLSFLRPSAKEVGEGG